MSVRAPVLHRRSVLGGLAAAAGAFIVGCSPKGGTQTRDSTPPAEQGKAMPDVPVQAAAMTLYRDPGCGCCEAWTDLARRAGYTVRVIDSRDMAGVKKRHGVPEQLTSCHTTLAGNYVIEGHVPLADVNRLLKDRPSGVAGIAVAGMPRGSPGMAMPDGSKDVFDVVAFDAAGKTNLFRAS